MNQDNIMVVFNDDPKDPSYSHAKDTLVMLMSDDATRNYNSITSMKVNGDVLKVYDLTKIMALMDQTGLLHTCEVDEKETNNV